MLTLRSSLGMKRKKTHRHSGFSLTHTHTLHKTVYKTFLFSLNWIIHWLLLRILLYRSSYPFSFWRAKKKIQIRQSWTQENEDKMRKWCWIISKRMREKKAKKKMSMISAWYSGLLFMEPHSISLEGLPSLIIESLVLDKHNTMKRAKEHTKKKTERNAWFVFSFAVMILFSRWPQSRIKGKMVSKEEKIEQLNNDCEN